MDKLRIVIGGFLGIMPAGGVTWDYIQYPLGFYLLNHDVYYIEDTRLYPIYQKPGSNWTDCSACVDHLQRVMNYFGMKDRWAYRDEASHKCFGMSETAINEICRTADLFINISCSTFMRDEYKRIPRRVLIDSDPMFTQIQYISNQLFTPGESGLKQMIDAHNYLFSFGENINSADCLIPTGDLHWYTTRQPVCIDKWNSIAPVDNNAWLFTTLMNWTAGKKLVYNNMEWGQKDIEFGKLEELPRYVKHAQFAMVISKTGGTENTFPQKKLERLGWKILDPEKQAGDWESYQQFISQSLAEFSVAKETYVKARTGWFSCRSACYLAAGRPVITQDTGWSKFISTGNGLFAFSDINEAVDAIQQVMSNKQYHSKAARELAEEYFNSDKVLNSLLQKIA
jgi:hypothetical protein